MWFKFDLDSKIEYFYNVYVEVYFDLLYMYIFMFYIYLYMFCK